jgi:hypothetical protein
MELDNYNFWRVLIAVFAEMALACGGVTRGGIS